MMIMPRPLPPYWPAYPEPERSRLERKYRKAEREWQRETSITLALIYLLPACFWLGIAVATIVALDIVRLVLGSAA